MERCKLHLFALKLFPGYIEVNCFFFFKALFKTFILVENCEEKSYQKIQIRKDNYQETHN
jgi:hypothetical protein